MYLVRWTPLREAWLAMHPHEDEADAPRWPSDHNRHAGKAIVKESLYKILRKIFADGENGYNESDLRIKYG